MRAVGFLTVLAAAAGASTTQAETVVAGACPGEAQSSSLLQKKTRVDKRVALNETFKSVKSPADDTTGGAHVALVAQPCNWQFGWGNIGAPDRAPVATGLTLKQAKAKCIEVGPQVCVSIVRYRSRRLGPNRPPATYEIRSSLGINPTPSHGSGYTIYFPPASCFPPQYSSVGIGECMTPQGPRGNHCYDGPSFNNGAGKVRTKAECQQECVLIEHCSAYEWGRNNYYNCALYIHTSTTMPLELSPHQWICNFWSAGPAGVNEVSRAHNFGHSGECFVQQSA